MNAPMVCASAFHEAAKLVPAWWRDQVLIGFNASRVSEKCWCLKNCRVCNSTLGKQCTREEMVMEPDGFWVSAEGYAQLASEQEARGFLDLAAYFYGRAVDAAVAKFDEACARRQLVGVDEVEDLEVTEVLPDPLDAYWERLDRDHDRAERRAGR